MSDAVGSILDLPERGGGSNNGETQEEVYKRMGRRLTD